MNRDCEEYVSTWYTPGMFVNSYRYSIHPLNGSDMWPQVNYTNPLPPKKRRLPGRPKLKRQRDEAERVDRGNRHTVSKVGVQMKCSICRSTEHNKARCPQRPTDGASTSNVKKTRKPKKPRQPTKPSHQKSSLKVDAMAFMGRLMDESDEEDDVEPDIVPDGVGEDVVDEVDVVAAVDEVDAVDAVDEEAGVQDDVVGQDGLDEVLQEPVVQKEQTWEDVFMDDSAGEQEAPNLEVIHQPPQRTRKVSERIIKIKLGKKIEGAGSSDQNPLQL